MSFDGVQKEMHEAQIGKLHGEMSRLRELLVECRGKERETQSIVNDLRLSLTDLQNLVRLARPRAVTTATRLRCDRRATSHTTLVRLPFDTWKSSGGGIAVVNAASEAVKRTGLLRVLLGAPAQCCEGLAICSVHLNELSQSNSKKTSDFMHALTFMHPGVTLCCV